MLFIIISLVSQARPPGVSISNTTARACSFCARSRMRFMKPKLCLLVRASSPTGMRTTLSRRRFFRGRPERSARKQSQKSQQQEVDVLHGKMLSRRVFFLNGEMHPPCHDGCVGNGGFRKPGEGPVLKGRSLKLGMIQAPDGRSFSSVSLYQAGSCDSLGGPYGKD